jgi:hypothetical protein
MDPSRLTRPPNLVIYDGQQACGGYDAEVMVQKGEGMDEDESMRSTSSMKDTVGNTIKALRLPHELLESRLVAALTSLRLAIEKVEASRQAPGDSKHILIVAMCSLESAIDSVELAEVASKRQLAADDVIMTKTECLECTTHHNNGHSTIFLNGEPFHEDHAPDDEASLSTEAKIAMSHHDTNKILFELREEEAALRSLLNMSILLRQQDDEDDDSEDETIVSSLDGCGVQYSDPPPTTVT